MKKFFPSSFIPFLSKDLQKIDSKTPFFALTSSNFFRICLNENLSSSCCKWFPLFTSWRPKNVDQDIHSNEKTCVFIYVKKERKKPPSILLYLAVGDRIKLRWILPIMHKPGFCKYLWKKTLFNWCKCGLHISRWAFFE